MMQMMSGTTALLGLVGAFCFTGCAPADDEDLGEAQQAEINPDVKVWFKMNINLADSTNTPVATMYIFNRPLGSYVTGTEYWFVNLSSLSSLGTYGLNITSTAQGTTAIPPDPYYASEQAFSLPNLSAWGTGWTTDPGSGGSLFSGPSQQSLRLTTGSTGLTNIRWYQVIANTATPHNLTVNGSFTHSASSVSVPSGYLGYSISQNP
jgi:hypothetical protein